MSQLIHLRQRIKAIDTIKKITHAMRLISMSTHSRFKNREPFVTSYTNEITNLFHTLQQHIPSWKHPLFHHSDNQQPKKLLILVGSNKGLCGPFNTTLFNFFKKEYPQETLANIEIATVGKKATDFIDGYTHDIPTHNFQELTFNSLASVAYKLVKKITAEKIPYTQVTILSSFAQNFFIQKPALTTIIPLSHSSTKQTTSVQEYAWEQKPEDLLDLLAPQYLETMIQNTLFQSLVAEQAARFLSMDTATRNAQTLLETTKLQYNKLRQTKITQEVTELSSSF